MGLDVEEWLLCSAGIHKSHIGECYFLPVSNGNCALALFLCSLWGFLQAEIEQLKHTLAHGCRTVTSGNRAPSLSEASLVQNSWPPAVSTKDC